MNTTSSYARHQRIEELEGIICRREDDRELRDYIIELQELEIPEDMFDNISSFDELYSRFSVHSNDEIRLIFKLWVDIYFKASREPLSVQRIVLANIEKTLKSDRVLLMGDIESNSVYEILEKLQKSIWKNPSALEDHDASIRDMGKEWASDFIESTKEVFRNRGGVIDNNEFWIDCIKPVSLQELYEILDRIPRNKGVQDEVFQRICTILPSCPGHEFDWGSIESIVSEVEKNNSVHVLKSSPTFSLASL